MSVSRLTILVLLLSAATASAQTASLGGSVTDAQRAVVADAVVRLTNVASQSSQTARTRPDGAFQFTGLNAGRYVLDITANGFAQFKQEVTLMAGDNRVDAMLQIAGVSEDVTVRGEAIAPRTTSKTNLPIRDVPITVHVVQSQTIREQGTNDLVSALRNVSGVNPYSNYGVYEYYMFRGFGFGNSVQLVDGMKNEGNRINTQLANIETIEVLKGPASALYGSEAIGGTINLIRKKPSAVPEYYFSVTGGRWSTVRSTFGATGPLGSNALLYRVDVGADKSDGWRHNDSAKLNITPALYWRIGARDQLNVHYNFNRDRFATDAGIPLVDTDSGAPRASSYFSDVPRDRRFNTPQDFALSFDHNLQVAYTRTINSNVGFRNTLSYRIFDDQYFSAEFLRVVPPSSVRREFLYFKHHRRPVTNVAELTGRFNVGVEQQVLVGYEGQRYYNYSHRSAAASTTTTSVDLFNPIETHVDRTFPLSRIDYFTNNTNAIYLQDHLTVTPELKVLLGGRLDFFRRYSHNDPVVAGVQTLGPEIRRRANPLTSRIGLVYQPIRWVDLYGSYANSYKPVLNVPADGRQLEPETGAQYEVGQRFHLFNDRVQINAATYHITKRNVTFSRPGGLFEQAGKQRSRGFEADVQAAPTARLRINGGYGLTDATYLAYVVSATRDLTGRTPKYSTRHIMNIWAGYEWSNGFGVNGGGRYLGSSFADDTNLVRLDGYAIVDLAARYKRGIVEYTLNITNALNKRYFVSALYDSQLYPGQPIGFLASIRVRTR